MKKFLQILLAFFLLFNLSSCNAYNSGDYKNKKTQISNNLKIKLDAILDRFFRKLDKKIKDNSKKIKVLNLINSRIDNLKVKKKENKKLILILDYLKQKIENKISKLKDLENAVCTMQYDPVCAIVKENTIRCITTPCPDNGVYKTFSNACEAKKAGYKIAYKGVCKTQNKDAVNNSAISSEQYQKLLKFGIDTDWAKYKKSIKNYKSSDVKAFAQKGFDHIRIRFGSDTGVSHLKKVVEDVLANNMIPIIAFDAGEFEENPSDENMQKVIEKWEQVANTFKDTDYKLSYDLIIEIGGKLNKNPDKANKLYEKLVSKIRETGGKNAKRIIIISPVKRSYPENLKLLKIPSKANGYLMAEWHMFAAGPNRCGPYMKWTTGTSQEKEFIRNKIKTALDWSEKNNIPTWVGAWMPGNYNKTFEKGCNNKYSIKEQIEFSSFMAQELKKNNIPFAINADRKFYDREKHEWIKDRLPVLDNLVKIMKK